MNNNEILKINELKDNRKALEKNIRDLVGLLHMHKETFKYPESIEALDRIDKYIDETRETCKNIDLNVENISKTLGQNCSHRIVIDRISKTECPICKSVFEHSNDIPDSSEYEIEALNYEEEKEKIDSIVLNSETETIANTKLLDYFSELQYSHCVKIRRLKK